MILTSPTDIPQFIFSQFEINETFKSCVLPDRTSLPIMRIAALIFFFCFFHIEKL